MPTEAGGLRLELDSFSEMSHLLSALTDIEKNPSPLVKISCSVDHFDRAQTTMTILRASNRAALLVLNPSETPIEEKYFEPIFKLLREWDQLTLHNFLLLCESKIPAEYVNVLKSEAKIELKWFEEWLVASFDTRIHRYPGLPWRSFIRRTVQENYRFVSLFLSGERIDGLMKGFLEEKKKVLCIFPKRWANA